ncbi:ATP-dependent protease ClpP protease subunit [Sedimentibacter acidaminivorans]|uniref:ATP-dependent Clp protease proteolytic subunit n=1 Tax=Sedimentibacter acidaminivorans TaxID=913099 RepID=A0ABS4GA95_9FIRM|nr:ATP-dependent protease ClpP protease subunit [Sedimentibacter acidaminivorans]
MARIKIKGVIIPNDYKWIYDWFEVDSTCPKDIEDQLEKANGEDLEIEINSGGGDVYSGSEIYTIIKAYSGKTIGKIMGLAASAASVIAMACGKLIISPTAQIMIHNVSSYASGDYRDLQHEATVLKNYNTSIANAYILKTGMTKDELLDLMDQESWFNAQQALEKKFVDEIMFDDNQKLVASSSNSQMIPLNVINKMRNEFKNKINTEIIKNPKNKENNVMNLEELKEKHPDLYDQIKKEGYAEGVKVENARIKEIEDLGVPGFEDLVNKAKFDTKENAETLAVNILKAQKKVGNDHLEATKKDAEELNGIEGSEAPEGNSKETDEKEGASLIAKFANKKREKGGTK